MHLTELAALYEGHPARADLAGYTERQLADTRTRYQAFFGAVRGRLDGKWAFEDADSGYLLLEGTRLKHEAGNLARYLVEDFTQYAVARKPPDARVLLIVDEFSAISRAGTQLVGAIEKVRETGAGIILAPQVLEGMGGAEAAARIGGSTHIRLVHQIPDPDEIVRVAGTRSVPEAVYEVEDGVTTGRRSIRRVERPNVDPNDVRRLPVGTCYAICEGRAAKVRVERAPEVPLVELPGADGDAVATVRADPVRMPPIRP